MATRRTATTTTALAALLAVTSSAFGQDTSADYQRANALRARYEALVANVPGPVGWIGSTTRFWYRIMNRGNVEFLMFDVALRQKRAAFDHEKLAAGLSKATGNSYTATKLPFTSIAFADDESTLDVAVEGAPWRCDLSEYTCRKAEPRRRPDDRTTRLSPDKKHEALIVNYNVAVRDAGATKARTLSADGSEGNAYELSSIVWSPDSTRLAVYRVKPGYRREVHYVESSPEDQLQPKSSSIRYAKPGDVLDVEQPVIFDVTSGREAAIDSALFPNAYAMSRLTWRKDSRAITFEYNQRGHQVYRLIEVDATSGTARAIVSEEPKTFFNYRTANGSQSDSGKKYRFDVADGREVIWMSERDG